MHYSLTVNALMINDVEPAIVGQICALLGLNVSFTEHAVPRLWGRKMQRPQQGSLVRGDEGTIRTLESAIRNRFTVNGKEVSSHFMSSFFDLCSSSPS